MSSFPVINLVPVLLLILLNASVKTVTSETPEDLTDPTGWSNSKYSIEENLIDPTGWNYDRNTKRYGEKDMFAYCDSLLKGRLENTQVKNNQEGRSNLQSSDSKNNIAFVRRFINLLLESANLNNPNNVKEDILYGLFEIKMKVEQYEKLIQFSQSRENISFGELDSILSNTIHSKEAVHEPFFKSVIEKIIYLASLTEVFLPFTLVLIGLYLVWLTTKSNSIRQFFLSIFPVIFLVAYIFEYYRRYKELEIEQMIMFSRNKDIPSSCSAEQNLWGRIVSYFQVKDECAKYHQAMLINPLYKVSPIGVLSCTFASIFTHPARMVGGAVADFSGEILGNLSLLQGLFVYSNSVVVITVIIVVALVLNTGGTIRFGNFFGGVKVSSSNAPLTASSDGAAHTNSTSSSSEALPQISSVDRSGKYILVEASTFKSLLAADTVSPANRIQELQHSIARSQSMPAELLEKSSRSASFEDSESMTPNETDLPPTGEMDPALTNRDIKEKHKGTLSKSQSYHGRSVSCKARSDDDETDEVK